MQADGDDHIVQKSDVELLAQSVEDSAHQQGAEQAMGHGAKGVNAVTLQGEDHVFFARDFLNASMLHASCPI